MSTFSAPAAPSGGIKWDDVKGHLVIVEPHSIETGIQTSFGETDAVKGDVTVLDGPNAGESHNDTLIFPRVLQSQLKSQIGQKVLGRVGQGQGKPGQSAPWILEEASPEDIETAEKWLAENKPTVTSAAAPF